MSMRYAIRAQPLRYLISVAFVIVAWVMLAQSEPPPGVPAASYPAWWVWPSPLIAPLVVFLVERRNYTCPKCRRAWALEGSGDHPNGLWSRDGQWVELTCTRCGEEVRRAVESDPGT